MLNANGYTYYIINMLLEMLDDIIEYTNLRRIKM